MKFIRIIISLLTVCLLCCGCASRALSDSVPVAEAGYTCNGEINLGDDFYADALISVNGGGVLSLEFTSPKVLEGMKFSTNRDSINITYKGIECPVGLNDEYSSLIKTISEAFLKITSGEPVAVKETRGYVITGTVMSLDFEFLFNDEGFPLRLSIPSKNLIVEFSNWQYV